MARKKPSIGCLFWIALVLLVLVIFLLNRNTIETVLERTGLVNYLTQRTQEQTTDPENQPPATDESEQTYVVKRQIEAPKEDEETAESTSAGELHEIIVQEHPEPANTDDNDSSTGEERSPIENTVAAERLRKSTLYFVQNDEDGLKSLAPVSRTVRFVDSPLTETIEILLKGLTSADAQKDLLSLVPNDTALLGINVRENTAYIDFNESFRFNRFGKEGYRYQLMQIVYTATEFQTVQHVQILVDGQIVPYLGAESPFVGSPLSRETFD